MKKPIILLFLLVAIAACNGVVSNSGSSPIDDNPVVYPDVSGYYERTSSDCFGIFDDEIFIHQDEGVVVLNPTSDGYSSVIGAIDASGNLSIDIVSAQCAGTIVDGMIDAICSEEGEGGNCHITFESNE